MIQNVKRIEFVITNRSNGDSARHQLVSTISSLMRKSLPGSHPAKHDSPTAKQRASGSRARFLIRPDNQVFHGTVEPRISADQQFPSVIAGLLLLLTKKIKEIKLKGL